MSSVSDVLAQMKDVAVSGGQERKKIRQRAEKKLEEDQHAGDEKQEQTTETDTTSTEQERGTTTPAPRPRAARGRGGTRKVKQTAQRDTVRHTLDLERPQHRFLKLYADDHRASTSQVMRVLLARLERDERLQSSVARELRRVGRAWVAATADEDG